jgi:hypothetical protein
MFCLKTKPWLPERNRVHNWKLEDFWRANIPSSTTSTHYVCRTIASWRPGVTAEPSVWPPTRHRSRPRPLSVLGQAMNKKMFKGCPVFQRLVFGSCRTSGRWPTPRRRFRIPSFMSGLAINCGFRRATDHQRFVRNRPSPLISSNSLIQCKMLDSAQRQGQSNFAPLPIIRDHLG